MRRVGLIVLLLATSSIPVGAQTLGGGSGCGPETIVQAGDTLSAIARRCDVDEGRILALNGDIDGSGDLIVGEPVALDRVAEETGTLDRLGDLAGDATRTLADTAREAGSAISSEVDTFLDDNPGVGRRIRDLTGTGPETEATVTATVEGAGAEQRLIVTADGLPAEAPLIVTGGPAGEAQHRLAEGRTDGAGRFTIDIPSPPRMDGDGYRVVVRGADGEWKAGMRL